VNGYGGFTSSAFLALVRSATVTWESYIMRIASVPMVGIAVLLSVCLGLLAGCNRANQYVLPPPGVTVARPLVKNVPIYAHYTGTTQAHASIEIRARVQGYLASIHFSDDSDTDVAEGDLLFVIDPRPYQAKLDAAKAGLESKKAMVTKTYAVYRRTELFHAESGPVSHLP
jgi:multidrug efflux pump subunit AcrA (membrane-fusion protein)